MKLNISLSTEVLDKDEIKKCWLTVFPNSRAVVTNASFGGTSLYVRCCISKDKTECPHGIDENDPLHYRFSIDTDTLTYKEYKGGPLLYIKPPVGSRLALGRVDLRAKTIKNVTVEKLLKRMREVRTLVMENSENLNNPQFDINTK